MAMQQVGESIFYMSFINPYFQSLLDMTLTLWLCRQAFSPIPMAPLLPLAHGSMFPPMMGGSAGVTWLDPAAWAAAATSFASAAPVSFGDRYQGTRQTGSASNLRNQTQAPPTEPPPAPASNAGPSIDTVDGAEDEDGPILSDKWRELLSRIPKRIEIFADGVGSGSDIRGVLYAHELLLGYPTKPPACVELMIQTKNGVELKRMTPSAAETLSGRGSRKSWKETLRTWEGGRAITLKTYFALHGV